MEVSVMETREEKDFLGTKEVPVDAYYGIQTLRAVENFPITGNKLHEELIKALAIVKKAAALANTEVGLLPGKSGRRLLRLRRRSLKETA